MKHTSWIILFASMLVLVMAGCGSAPNATPIPSISLDAPDTSKTSQVQASAVVVPAQETRLSFVIAGMVENVSIAEGDQVQSGQELVKIDTSELEYNVVAAEADLTTAEIDAQIQRQRKKEFSFNTFNFIYVSPPGEKVQAADARVDQMQSALEVVKESIAQRTLTAPFDGTVVEVNVSPGEYVQPAQIVIVLVDLDNLQIETTDLSELDVSAVKIGQLATVYIEALDKEFSGEVTAISPISDTIGGDVVFKVTIQLDEKPEALLWGMSAEVNINVE